MAKVSKRTISLLLAGSIGLTCLTGCGAIAEIFPKDDKVVATDNVNMRTEDNTDSEVIGRVKINEEAERLFTTENGWSLVRYSDHLGFVSGDYVAEIEEANPLYNYEELVAEAKTTSGVNLRLGPSTEYTSIKQISANREVEILAKTNNNWYLVKYNDELGFIIGDYLDILTYDVSSDGSLTNTSTPTLLPAIKATTNVKIREGASEDSKQLDLLRKGSSIKVISKLDNGWYEVSYNGGSAYVCGDYVEDSYVVEGNYFKVVYLTSDAYLYDAPNGNVIGTVPQYESGKVYSLDDKFYLVATDDNQVGYISVDNTATLTDPAVVVDISSQTMTVYSNNGVVLISPIVSGKASDPDRVSDIGIFSIYKKERDTSLTDGATYDSPVSYWMPYNNGEGLHDATWRTRFGGDIYKTQGSHGCINLPLEKAAALYDLVNVDTNVLVKK